MSVVKSYLGFNVRFEILENKEIITHATDLATALFFRNPARDIMTNVWAEYRFKHVCGVGQPPWYLREPGVWQLTFASEQENACKIQRWVFEDVLPSIRKDGGYISPDATPTQLESLEQKIRLQMAAIEQSYQVCKDAGDDRGIITLKSQLLNLTNRLDGVEAPPHQQWLSVSEHLEKKYNLRGKKAQTSLSAIGKTVKAEYVADTGEQPRTTPKHVGSGHSKDDMTVYPPEWFEHIERIAVSYWQTSKWATSGKGMGVWDEVQ